MTVVMQPQTLYITDVIERLQDLKAFSPELMKRMEHEEELPDDPDLVHFLVRKIETACAQLTASQSAEETEAASDELGLWLQRSYRYYISRLVTGGLVWRFEFPRREEMSLQ